MNSSAIPHRRFSLSCPYPAQKEKKKEKQEKEKKQLSVFYRNFLKDWDKNRVYFTLQLPVTLA